MKEGEKAIDFLLEDKDGEKYSLKDFNSDYLVLYFYPRDSTPGCTIQAQEFTKNLDKFKKLNAFVLGISGGNEETKKKFYEKFNLKVLLLSDPDYSISAKYGVYEEKSFLGRKFLGIKRTTFVLDKNRNIIKVFEKVNPKKHSEEVMDFIKRL